ncbi:MAG TPA: hypothetical protein VM843_01750 [Flavisolibacter sp.]|nr:hypothetical protein [Flavisolibacter sp.]
MDTRKLLAAFAFTCSSLTLFATALYKPHVQPAYQSSIARLTLPAEDIVVYQDANGSNVVKWNAQGPADLEYLLQGSKDGKAFRLIKKITAATHAGANGHYEAIDDSGRGYVHFRIIRINKEGQVSYSKIVSAP